MLRISEMVLFLAPFAAVAILYAVFFRGQGVSRQAVLTATLVVAGFGAYLAWLGISQRLDPIQRYVPAVLHNGDIVPGHGSTP